MFARYLALIAVTVTNVAADKLCGTRLCQQEVGHGSYCKDYQRDPAGRVCQTLDPKDTRIIPCECPKPTPTTTTTTQPPTPTPTTTTTTQPPTPPHRPCTLGDFVCDLATQGGICRRLPGWKFVGKCDGGSKPDPFPCFCI
ncbi:hypothetical protein Pmar_PMAR023825 [Perkinsus marinus ATCC 50983]|uniref:Merozoite surface protein 2 n=1 Tax=Perkinsus marinus (strain ATCC 50983 / TXsc) TaxID=423536 RepID=C5KYL6_PERM5|nr:hypothetical protein Pmar_PMAR023825 [Perkinsus marinus ATCC 50983]EER10451.1 hypothetical protein Pmar_PMAR023825 [Perkinsus marinus ATCC 50983]|eukprot:XP_002778656.1 hypothetical protein Pmar_PMAR023825 [Perkinsus marinus ATCC 50983]